MTKVKVFRAFNESSLTDMINDWLKNTKTKNLDFKFSTTCVNVQGGRQMIAFCVLVSYEESEV